MRVLVDFFAGLFLAVPLELLLALVFAAVPFLAALPLELLLALVLAAVPFLAVVPLELLLALVFAVVLFAVVLFAAVLAGDFLAWPPVPLDSCAESSSDPAFCAAFLADVEAFAAVSTATLGSFFAPDTTARRSAPARNFGTAIRFDVLCSPDSGSPACRTGRIAFSKAPKPVIATFSPRATSLAIVSSTDSSAC